MISNLDEWYKKQIEITTNYYINHTQDVEGINNVINWIWKNVSYEEYLNYKKQVIDNHGVELYIINFQMLGIC